jgi:acetyl esterase/lipase
MGWLGWSFTAILGIAALLAVLAAWAIRNDAVALLDGVDALFPRDRTARLVEAAHYGPDPAQKLEMFVPSGAAPAAGWPLIAFYHGGGWHNGDPHSYRFIARTFADRGYAVALIGYRLNQGGRYPAMLEDSAGGLKWAMDHAARHRIDPSRTIVMGHSAGAYNAVMLALDARWTSAAGLPANAIKGAVGLAGPYDFYPWTSDSARDAMGHWPNPRETLPIAYARRDAPPLLLVAGTADTLVRPRNSRALAAAMAALGKPAELALIDGMGHNGLVITLARPFGAFDHRVRDALLPFLAAQTGAAGAAAKPASTPASAAVQAPAA